jgi:Ca2+-binding RTX toxin-like protein
MGWDEAEYWSSTVGIIVDLRLPNGQVRDGLGGIDTLIGIEAIGGSQYDDVMVGSDDMTFGKQESFAGGKGNDTIDGGGGYDEVSYNYGSPTTGVNVNLAIGTAQDGFGTTDTLYNMEGVEGSDLNDTIVGSAADNRLDGRGGDDMIDGGAGNDWVEYNNASGSVVVDLAAGRATGAAGNDTISNIENVLGSVYDDFLVGDAGSNILRGGRGNDTMDGGAGVDTAVYSGNLADYTLSRNGQLWTISTANREDGTDTIGRIEKLQFADQTYILNNAPNGAIKINGLLAQNKVLSATIGTLADADGLGTMTYQWRANGVDIKNATGSTFTLTQAEVGKAMTLSASYTDGQGNQESSVSAASAPVSNVNDAPTGFVKVMGQLQQGQTLQALNTLSDADGMGTVSYQWYADAAPITMGTGSKFTLLQAHVGKAISIMATYTDGFGKAETVWSPTTEAVANLNDAPVGAPTITGSLWAGQTLTAQTNGISDADSVGALGGFQYKWFADGDAIDAALASTLILTSDLVGKSISVEASYVDGGDTEETLLSAATGEIAAKETLGVVTVSGNARQGQLLQATLSDADGVATAVTWKWFANGAEISGQTGSIVQLSQAQVNKTIAASASYTDTHGNVYAAVGVGALAPVLSNVTASVANVNDAPTGAVTITGIAMQGKPLKAVTSTLADADGLGVFSYQWMANGVNISGATGSSFTPNLQSQVGQKMSVTVSYTDGFGAKESKTSALTALVLAGVNDAPTGSIIVSGTPSVGSTLTASNTFVDPNGAVGAVSYTWSMSTTLGGVYQSIGSGAALQFGAAQLNQNIRVTATYSDGIFTNTVVSGVLRLGTTGIDSINGAELDDRLFGNDGNDVLSGVGGNDTLSGGAGNDTLTGDIGNDTFNVDVGSDFVTDLGNGADVLIVAAGATANVTMVAAWNATAATVNNGVVNINTNGYAVNLALAGGTAGFNVTNTGSLSTSGTTLTGSSLANTLTSGAGNDTLIGGAGNDTYMVNAGTDLVTELANGGTDLVSSSATYVLSANVENLTLTGATAINGTGNELNNTITGNSAANVLDGAAGDDTLRGAGGNDSLTGGAGNDTFVVDIGTDTIADFGLGADILVVSAGAIANVTMATAWTANASTANAGSANIFTNGFVVNLAAATGSAGFNVTNTGTATTSGTTLTGSSAANTLTSGAGNDTLVGGAGNDTYVVNAGTDVVIELANGGTDLVSSSATYVLSVNVENLTLTGATAINGMGNVLNNTIIGNSAANILAGGLGRDTLTGGSGADKFLFNVLETTANRDTITDFSVLDGDKIQFSKSVFAGLAGLSTITTANLALDGATQTAATRLTYSNTTGVLSYDADGSGTGQAVEVALIGVTTHAALTASQFELLA